LASVLAIILSPLLFLTLCTMIAGCAGVSYRTIGSESEDEKARGLRYYDSSPYLLVQTDNQGGLTSELVYLPDLNKKRHAQPFAFLASNTTTLEFQKGILTNNSSDTDATAVPVAVIKSLEQVAGDAVKLAKFDIAGGAQHPAPNVYLFKIVKVDGQWGLVGADGRPIQY
jgi:hypothetical protein